MSQQWPMSQLEWLAVGLLVWGFAVWGCATQDKPASTPIESRWEAPEPVTNVVEKPIESAPGPGTPPPPATSAETRVSDPIIAVINGTPIMRSAMIDALFESHGLDLLEQLALLTAARQRAQKMGLKVTQTDIKAAHEDALRQIATPISDPNRKPLSRSAARRLLAEFLEAKNLSRREWDRRMEQSAYLRKIAEAEVASIPITEKMLRQQYALQYGERVQIRHIQLPNLEAVTQARQQLAKNKDFELVARQLSKNPFTASQGGLMPPFSRDDSAVPPLIRETSFAIEQGEISPAINESDWYHIIRLERRFPASAISYENMNHAVLRKRLVARLVQQRQTELEAELFEAAAATIDLRDSRLRQKFRDKHQQTAR